MKQSAPRKAAGLPHIKRQSRKNTGPGASYSRFTIHYLLLQLIGSDRSAFVADATRWLRN